MSKLVNFVVAIVFYTIFVLSYVPPIVSVSKVLKLKLFHIDSPYSPLYQANLSTIQKLQRDRQLSYLRSSYFESITTGKAIHIPFTHPFSIFTAEISIGTPAKEQYLHFDTASDLTWTQCKDCIHCFHQDTPLFNTKESRSFKKMKSTHHFAENFDCTSGKCLFDRKYSDDRETSGYLGLETFHFGRDSYNNVAFGCGIHSYGYPGVFHPRVNKISGILGMDRGPLSIWRQLQNVTSFSYCIPSSHSTYSYVQFGPEATIHSNNVQKTPFIGRNNDPRYLLNLNGISIAGRRLQLAHTAFSDGCLIDSGSSISSIKQEVYDDVVNGFVRYFTQFNYLERHFGGPRTLCYSNKQHRNFYHYPSMTFHFEGANLEVPPENLFLIMHAYFCLELIGESDITILGSYQQQNVRFMYDNRRGELSFAKEDCSEETI